MSNQLVICKRNNQILSCLLEDKQLVQINATDLDQESLLGNIYIGKVKNIVKNINAAFVEIADGVMCYLSLENSTPPIFVNNKNTDKVVIGDEIIVQIEKEGIKTKAPVVTSNLAFVGKYAILTYGKTKLGVSNKITDDTHRKALRNVIGAYKSEEYGLVVRTNAEAVSPEVIREEVEMLITKYKRIKEYGIHKTCFSVLDKAPKNYLSDIRDGYDAVIEQIVTDDQEIYDEIKTFLEENQASDVHKLQFYNDRMVSLSNLYSIETKVEKALQERVWLKSGGYLVIQPTEALVVIDVNTGKAIQGKKRAEETFFKINKEAAIEIAKQVRLRNLSGIIIIDFIDVASEAYKEAEMELLRKEFSKDPVKTIVVEMTKLNLVEVTRKKVRKPLHEQMKK
ncbi:MAG: ribonuclease E/G [bacterium]|nr:ribonuclease E/G [bacterium]